MTASGAGRYKQQLANDGVRPTETVGWLSWMWVGEKVDAISHTEQVRGLGERLVDIKPSHA